MKSKSIATAPPLPMPAFAVMGKEGDGDGKDGNVDKGWAEMEADGGCGAEEAEMEADGEWGVEEVAEFRDEEETAAVTTLV